ncbi:MAG: hypothetical protein ACW98D_07960 [Promethearchaeota archaeon]|jgi:hypothetical protein
MVKKKIILISLVLIIGFSGLGTTIFVFYENPKENSGYFEISKEGIDVSAIEIDNKIQKGNIDILTLPENSSNLFEAEWTINYKGFNEPNSFINIRFEAENSILRIFTTLSAPDDILYLDLSIAFNPTYDNYSFKSDGRTCNINFNTHQVNYSAFEIKTSSGTIDIKLNKSSFYDDFKIASGSGVINLILDHSIFYKDFTCTSESGDQWFDIWNIWSNFLSDFNASSSSGRINVKWANHFNNSHTMNINLNSPNDVYIKMWSPIEITNFDIFYEADTGTTQFSKAFGLFEEVGFQHYQSYNINASDLDFINIRATTSYGHVHVFIVDCFKWQRFCNQANDFIPYDVPTSGQYIIPKDDHNVTTIEFYNLNYIYLNITEYLDINYQILPDNTSDNIIDVVWDLTYQHAMGIGVGNIEVGISNNTEGNTLKVYFDLKYEIDRIIPTFTNYNVTVLIDPDYSFYNYTL